jgi:4-amino-4-deoxy-L-arabinose transferase-like glycosyltransferase
MVQSLVVASAPRIVAIVGAFLALHVTAWVCLPALFEGSLRLDGAEHVLQGREWLLTYPKHPPFSAWLVAIAGEFGAARYLAIYLLGQALAVLGLVLAALLLLRERGAVAAALAVLIGLASPFLTYVPIQVNHNIGVMPFWGLALLAGFLAFERGRVRDWLLFGAAIGFGMWAKYSILHLAMSLAMAFFVVPTWRRQVATPGPWLAAALATVIIAPHVAVLVTSGSDALGYALRTNVLGYADNVKSLVGFVLGGAAMMATMSIVPAAAVGFEPLRRAVAQYMALACADRLTLYLGVALFGPIGVIALSSLFAVRPRVFWLTPIALSAAVWWANMAYVVRNRLPDRAIAVAATIAVLIAASYAAWRHATPFVSVAQPYADFDGPALARLAERHWRNHSGGPIPYIVSFASQRGRQAAGSLAFDLSDRPHVFEDADPKRSPWIDVADVARRGGLVVSVRPLTSADTVAGRPIEAIESFPRPTVRPNSRLRTIYFGIVRPLR